MNNIEMPFMAKTINSALTRAKISLPVQPHKSNTSHQINPPMYENTVTLLVVRQQKITQP
jgi:hypothetical protein